MMEVFPLCSTGLFWAALHYLLRPHSAGSLLEAGMSQVFPPLQGFHSHDVCSLALSFLHYGRWIPRGESRSDCHFKAWSSLLSHITDESMVTGLSAKEGTRFLCEKRTP